MVTDISHRRRGGRHDALAVLHGCARAPQQTLTHACQRACGDRPHQPAPRHLVARTSRATLRSGTSRAASRQPIEEEEATRQHHQCRGAGEVLAAAVSAQPRQTAGCARRQTAPPRSGYPWLHHKRETAGSLLGVSRWAAHCTRRTCGQPLRPARKVQHSSCRCHLLHAHLGSAPAWV